MIASKDKGFVLLSNPKCGTTSLEQAFSRYCEIKVNGPPHWKHINYGGLKRIFGDFFDEADCKIYVAVRDPIDTLASWYRYRTRRTLSKSTHPMHQNYTGALSFDQFVSEWASSAPPPRARVKLSTEFCMYKGQLAPLTYYRYEDLPRLYDVLSRHVGESPTLRQLNVSPRAELEIDRDAIAARPRMQKALEIYASIPFV